MARGKSFSEMNVKLRSWSRDSNSAQFLWVFESSIISPFLPQARDAAARARAAHGLR